MDNAAQVKHARNQLDKMQTLDRMNTPKELLPNEKKLFKTIVNDMVNHSLLITTHKEIIIKYCKLETTIQKLQDEIINNDGLHLVGTLNSTLRLQNDILSSLNLTPQKMVTAAKYMPDKGDEEGNPFLNAIKEMKK